MTPISAYTEDTLVQQTIAEYLEQELKRDYHIITAGKRLDQVARDFVQHYSLGWESGKAILVCIDKITCVCMHKLVEFYWNERIGELEAQLPQATDEQDERDLRRQIEWMWQTQMAVVVSEEQGEVEKFRKWELDITPHRRLIKEGIDLPEAMRKLPQFQNMPAASAPAEPLANRFPKALRGDRRRVQPREGSGDH